MPAHEIPAKNKLYYGDNLAVLRDYIPSNSVDLIYLERLVELRRVLKDTGYQLGYA